jgi:predicted PurR-regulated permease PerM
MVKLFFTTVVFIFISLIFIVSATYTVDYINLPIEPSSSGKMLILGLLISFSGGGIVVFGLSIIRQIAKIIKVKDKFEEGLPPGSFIRTDKPRPFISKFINQKKSILFLYILIFLIFIILGGIIWKITYDFDEMAIVGNNDTSNNNNIPDKKSPDDAEIPSSDIANITGYAILSSVFNTFSGSIYNGCRDWNIKRLVIRITVEETNGTIRWSRDFDVLVNVPTFSVERFSISVNEAENIGLYQWSIVKVWGYK